MDYRKRADRVLCAVFVLMVATVGLNFYFPKILWLELAQAAAQAAFIGGLADWFAVTALFRRPLGIPWHTALIPRSRDRIIRGLAVAVEQELVSLDAITRRLAGVRLTPLLIAWADTNQGRAFFRGLAARCLRAGLDNASPATIACYLESIIRNYLTTRPLAPELQKIARWALVSGHARAVADIILDEFIRGAQKPATRQAILSFLEKYTRQATSPWQRTVLWLAERTDAVNLAELAAVLQLDLVETLTKVRQGDHPLRQWLRERAEAWVEALGTDPIFAAKVEAWKEEALARLNLSEPLLKIAATALQAVRTGLAAGVYHSPLLAATLSQADGYLRRFKQDPHLQAWLEGYLQEALHHIVRSEHSFIGAVVETALARFDAEGLNRFVEDKVGEDLAWIRINGSVVGAAVGLLLQLFVRFIYEPYAVPLMRAWFS